MCSVLVWLQPTWVESTFGYFDHMGMRALVQMVEVLVAAIAKQTLVRLQLEQPAIVLRS